jgi:hypothetical protein
MHARTFGGQGGSRRWAFTFRRCSLRELQARTVRNLVFALVVWVGLAQAAFYPVSIRMHTGTNAPTARGAGLLVQYRSGNTNWYGAYTSLYVGGTDYYQTDMYNVNDTYPLEIRGYDPFDGYYTPVQTFNLTGGQWVDLQFMYLVVPSVTTSKWVHSLTNSGVLAAQYKLKLDFATGEDVEQTILVQPGATLNLAVEDTRTFTVSLEAEGPAPDAQGNWFVPIPGLPAVTAGTQTPGWTAPAPTASAGPGNVYAGGAPAAVGTQTPITQTPQTRVADYSDATKATETADKNAEARHKELREVLLGANDKATERANLEAATVAAAVERLRVTTKAGFDGLMETAETVEAPGEGDFEGLEAADQKSRLTGRFPSIGSVGTGSGSVLTVPLSAVGLAAGVTIDDVSLDFSKPEWAWTSMLRPILVCVLTFAFCLGCVRLLEKMVGA